MKELSMFNVIDNHMREISKKQDLHIANLYRRKYGESPFLKFMGNDTNILTEEAKKRLSECTIERHEPVMKEENGTYSMIINFEDIKIFDENGEEW